LPSLVAIQLLSTSRFPLLTHALASLAFNVCHFQHDAASMSFLLEPRCPSCM